MKKILLMLVVSFVLFGCASAPVEFDPTETPFEGEWLNFDPDFNVLTFKFTGNRWEFTYKDFYSTGLFSYTEKVMYTFESIVLTQGKIQFITENGKWTQEYEFVGSYRFNFPQTGSSGRRQTGFGPFVKQPYGDLVINYVTKEKKFSDIITTNEDLLTKIQGSWKHTNPIAKGATYTFSGNKFTFTVNDGRKPISGTVKIAGNILYLIVSDDQFGIDYLNLLSENIIYLNVLYTHNSLYRGHFKKQ